MRLSLLYGAALALTAAALPSRHVPPSPDQPDKIYPRSNQTKPADDITITCDINQRNRDNWKKFEMDMFVETVANQFYAGSKLGAYDRDFQLSIEKLTTGIYGIDCQPIPGMSCAFQPSTEDCQKGANAYYYFILTAIANFNNFLITLQESIQKSYTYVHGMAGQLVQTFTSDKKDPPIDQAPLVIVASLLGAFGAFIGPVAADAGIIAGGFSGMIGAVNGGIGEINNHLADVLQTEFDDFAGVTSYLANATGHMQDAVQNYGIQALTTTPKNDPKKNIFYSEDPNGVPMALKNGSFAQQIEASKVPTLQNTAKAALFSGAISYLWVKEQVYVVKMSKPLYGVKPCDLKMNSDFKDIAQFCNKKTGTAYFYVKNSAPSEIYQKWPPAPGVDKLKDWNLDPIDVANAAAASQSAGGYLKNWDPKGVMKLFDSKTPPVNNLLFNIPYCDLDLAYSAWPKKPSEYIDHQWKCDQECWLKNMLYLCFLQTADGQKWPYKSNFNT